MAEKSDDIKNLFLNLGLNPSDYHEIRTAPTANVTVSEAPRRWSLLQSAAAPKPLAAAAPAVAAPASGPFVSPPAPPQAAPATDSMFAAALLAAAQDIVRAEATGAPFHAPAPEVAADRSTSSAAPLPDALAGAFAAPSHSNDGLQSLFQSVKEPQTAAMMPVVGEGKPTERRAQQLFEAAIVPSLAERAAEVPELHTPLLPPTPRLLDDEPETRFSPPPSRLGPLPTPTPGPLPTLAPETPAAGRLRFTPSAATAPATHGESLQDVFRRLTRDNRG